jgi:hypothetical protein
MKNSGNRVMLALRRMREESSNMFWIFLALVAFKIGDWLDLADKDYHDDL